MECKPCHILSIFLGLQAGCSTTLEGPIKLRPFESAGPPVAEADRPELRQSLQSKLDDGKVRSVQWQDGEKTRNAMTGDHSSSKPPPTQVLQLANAVASYPDSEVDGLVIVQGERRAATARHEADGKINVVVGNPPTDLNDLPQVTAEELSTRFGIGPVIGDENRNWTQTELRAISVALSLLSEEELLLLENLPFVRSDKSSVMFGLLGHHMAYVSYGSGTPYPSGSITFFDLGSDLNEHYIAGPPDQAYPYSCYVLLHEFGHAVSQMTRMALVTQYNENLTMLKVLAAAQQSKGLRRKLKMNRTEVTKLMRDIQDYNKQARKILRGPSPMERAYGDLAGVLPGPTRYGRTSLTENFAEAFALYHLDPEALRRISPQAVEWFESGQHIRSIDYPGWTQVSTELDRIQRESAQQRATSPTELGPPRGTVPNPTLHD